MAETQSFKNHGKFDPTFHFFLVPVGLFLLISVIVMAWRNFDWLAIVRIVGMLWAIVLMFKVRIYALKVQDRVIRLEERLRLQDVLPAELQPRIGELTEDQLIGLRFASNSELPRLVEKALLDNWDRKQIKAAVENWRPDYWRV